jgi:hypothetical protein
MSTVSIVSLKLSISLYPTLTLADLVALVQLVESVLQLALSAGERNRISAPFFAKALSPIDSRCSSWLLACRLLSTVIDTVFASDCSERLVRGGGCSV